MSKTEYTIRKCPSTRPDCTRVYLAYPWELYIEAYQRRFPSHERVPILQSSTVVLDEYDKEAHVRTIQRACDICLELPSFLLKSLGIESFTFQQVMKIDYKEKVMSIESRNESLREKFSIIEHAHSRGQSKKRKGGKTIDVTMVVLSGVLELPSFPFSGMIKKYVEKTYAKNSMKARQIDLAFIHDVLEEGGPWSDVMKKKESHEEEEGEAEAEESYEEAVKEKEKALGPTHGLALMESNQLTFSLRDCLSFLALFSASLTLPQVALTTLSEYVAPLTGYKLGLLCAASLIYGRIFTRPYSQITSALVALLCSDSTDILGGRLFCLCLLLGYSGTLCISHLLQVCVSAPISASNAFILGYMSSVGISAAHFYAFRSMYSLLAERQPSSAGEATAEDEAALAGRATPVEGTKSSQLALQQQSDQALLSSLPIKIKNRTLNEDLTFLHLVHSEEHELMSVRVAICHDRYVESISQMVLFYHLRFTFATKEPVPSKGNKKHFVHFGVDKCWKEVKELSKVLHGHSKSKYKLIDSLVLAEPLKKTGAKEESIHAPLDEYFKACLAYNREAIEDYFVGLFFPDIDEETVGMSSQSLNGILGDKLSKGFQSMAHFVNYDLYPKEPSALLGEIQGHGAPLVYRASFAKSRYYWKDVKVVVSANALTFYELSNPGSHALGCIYTSAIKSITYENDQALSYIKLVMKNDGSYASAVFLSSPLEYYVMMQERDSVVESFVQSVARYLTPGTEEDMKSGPAFSLNSLVILNESILYLSVLKSSFQPALFSTKILEEVSAFYEDLQIKREALCLQLVGFSKKLSILSVLRLNECSEHEKLIFYINIYHTLLLHESILSCIAPHVDYTKLKYSLFGYNYNYLEIEHTLVRGPLSRPIIGEHVSLQHEQGFIKYGSKDPRRMHTSSLMYSDPIINFILASLKTNPTIFILSPDTTHEDLESMASHYLNSVTTITTANVPLPIIKLPVQLQWFSRDFDNTKDKRHLFKVCLNYVSPLSALRDQLMQAGVIRELEPQTPARSARGSESPLPRLSSSNDSLKHHRSILSSIGRRVSHAISYSNHTHPHPERKGSSRASDVPLNKKDGLEKGPMVSQHAIKEEKEAETANEATGAHLPQHQHSNSIESLKSHRSSDASSVQSTASVVSTNDMATGATNSFSLPPPQPPHTRNRSLPICAPPQANASTAPSSGAASYRSRSPSLLTTGTAPWRLSHSIKIKFKGADVLPISDRFVIARGLHDPSQCPVCKPSS